MHINIKRILEYSTNMYKIPNIAPKPTIRKVVTPPANDTRNSLAVKPPRRPQKMFQPLIRPMIKPKHTEMKPTGWNTTL